MDELMLLDLMNLKMNELMLLDLYARCRDLSLLSFGTDNEV